MYLNLKIIRGWVIDMLDYILVVCLCGIIVIFLCIYEYCNIINNFFKLGLWFLIIYF